MSTSTLTTQLHALESTGLIQLAPSESEIEFMFRHALVQDAAYASLLKRDREQWHHLVGETLERMYPGRVDAFEWSAMLGYHFARANVHDKAWRYLAQAGDGARNTYANVEAIGFYRAAIHEIDQSSRSDDALDNIHLQLHEALGDILSLIGRALDAATEYERALAHVTRQPSIAAAQLHRKMGNTWDARRELDQAFQAYTRAEQALGQPSSKTDRAWRQVWCEIQLDRMFIHYWRADWRALATLADATRPIIERDGTPLLQARFYDRLAGVLIRRDRYVISDEILNLTQAGLFASEASGNLREITNARFNMGFAYLWRNTLDDAQRYLQSALQLAQHTGDVTYQTWCLTYLAVLCRKRGEVADARRLALQTLDVASSADLTPWIAAAHANLAWVAYREGDLSEAQRIGHMALRTMQKLSLIVPFYWLAVWPLIVVAHAQDAIDMALEYVGILLLPTQQPLPEAIAAHLEQVVRAGESDDTQTTRMHLRQALELAQQSGYL